MPAPHRTRPESSTVPAAGRPTGRWNPRARGISRCVFQRGTVEFGTDPEDRVAAEPGDVGHRERQQADRRRARPREGRHAAALQLRRLHRARRDQVVRGQVLDQGGSVDVQRHRRGHHQDPRRQRRLRHLLPELRPDQPAGQRRVGPSDQPQLRPQHQECLAVLHQPLVRPGVAVHGALHRLHHRHRLAYRPGARRHRRAEESL